jgi:hypothetical protein
LPSNVVAQVRRLAKARRLSAGRMWVDFAGRFGDAIDPAPAERQGDQMGRMVFDN